MANPRSIVWFGLTVVALVVAAFWLSSGDALDKPSGITDEQPVAADESAPSPSSDGTRVTVLEQPGSAPSGPARVDAPAEAAELDAGPPRVRVEVRRAGRVVAGVEVHLELAERTELQWSSAARARTDELGIARFDAVQAGLAIVSTALGGHLEVLIAPRGETTAKLALPRGYRIEGTVVDDEDHPVVGAAIWLSRPWRETEGTIVARSDAVGGFAIDDVVFERFVGALVERRGSTLLAPVHGKAGELVVVHLRLPTMKLGSVIGRVLDDEARPIVGAEVLLMAGDQPPRVRDARGESVPREVPNTARSDAAGQFELVDVRVGATDVHARAPGFAAGKATIEVSAGVAIGCELTLARGATLTGTVRDASGAPVPLAFVEHAPRTFGGVRRRADAEGVFQLPDLPVGELRIEASSDNRLGATLVAIETPGSEVQHDVTIDGDRVALPGSGKPRLRGTLVDVAGEPLARWVLWLRAVDAADVAVRQRAMTDALGRFDVEVDWPIVSISAHVQNGWRGLPALFVERHVVGDAEVTLRVPGPLEQTGGIRGRVLTYDGRPQAALLTFWHRELRLHSEVDTDPQTGTFELTNAWPGTYDIRIQSADAPWLQPEPKTVSVGNWLELGDLVTAAAGRVEGTLRTRDGAVPRDVRCELLRDGVEAGVIEVTGNSFRSNPVAVGDAYLLVVQADGYVSRVEEVAVTRGGITTLDLALEPATRQELRFVAANGTGLPRWMAVHVRDAGSGALLWSGAVQAADGGKVVASLPIGSFEVEALAPSGSRGRWPLSIDGSSPRPPVEFVLR